MKNSYNTYIYEKNNNMADRFPNIVTKINNISYINPKDAYNLIIENDCILVDLREEIEKSGKEFNIPHDKLLKIPFCQFSEHNNLLPTSKPIILADSVGIKSKYAFQILSEKGYTNICILNGGILEWHKDGLPTIINEDEILVGQCACKLKPKGLFKK